MLNTLLTIALFWAVFFTITLISHYIYNIKLWSPKPFGYWDNYPFRCYRCCTTWALITTYIMTGILLADVAYTLFGVVLSGLYGYGLLKTDNERFEYGKRDMERN